VKIRNIIIKKFMYCLKMILLQLIQKPEDCRNKEVSKACV